MFPLFKIKINSKSIYKIVTRLLCFLGLLFNATDLLREYWQGETSVSILIERKINNTLPAITLCYPYSISFKKISQLNDKYQNSYNAYLGHLFNHSFDGSAFDLVQMRNIYHIVINEVFEQINNFSLNINQVFNNYSIDLHNDQGDKLIKIMFNRNDVTDIIGNPIESFEINKDHFGKWKNEKCFTYFSALDATWRKSYVQISEIHITLNYSLIQFPFKEPSKVMFAMHSPNTLPNLNDENFEYLSMDHHSYICTYSLLNTKLLDSNYDTNCLNYDLDYKFYNNNMRSDCLAWCYQKTKNDQFNSNNFFPSWSLFRKEALSHLNNTPIGSRSYYLNNPLLKLSSTTKYCLDKCQKDCKFTYYSTNTKVGQIKNRGHFDIFILHNNLPDIFITYLPKINFLSLVCNFGGLLGMWLGISILVIIEDLNKLFTALTRKSINIIQFKVKNNQNIEVRKQRITNVNS